MTKINFPVNVPVPVRLNSIEGKERESQFGPVQHLFTTDDGIFYVSETAGKVITDQCRKLGVRPGDEIEICKAEIDQGRGRKSLQWVVSFPVSDAAEPKTAAEPPVPHKPVAVAQTAAHTAPETPGWTVHLLQQTNALTTVFAAALQHANGLGAGIKPDDVRALMTSAYISMTQRAAKESNNRAA